MCCRMPLPYIRHPDMVGGPSRQSSTHLLNLFLFVFPNVPTRSLTYIHTMHLTSECSRGHRHRRPHTRRHSSGPQPASSRVIASLGYLVQFSLLHWFHDLATFPNIIGLMRPD